MKILKDVERRFRKIRDKAINHLFSGRKGRKLLIDIISKNLKSATMDCGDHLISFSPSEYVGKSILVSGDFDRQSIHDLLEILQEKSPKNDAKPFGTVLEIGANIGTQSIYFAKSNKVSRILSVEPDPRNIYYLNKNISMNNLGDVITVVPCAVGSHCGKIELFRSTTNYGGSSTTNFNHNYESIFVDLKTVDTILSENNISEDEISIIWMDIEGAEPDACKSMTNLLKRRVPMMMEYSPEFYGQDKTRDFVAFLSDFYEKCMIFDDRKRKNRARNEINVSDLPLTGKQLNVLFLP